MVPPCNGPSSGRGFPLFFFFDGPSPLSRYLSLDPGPPILGLDYGSSSLRIPNTRTVGHGLTDPRLGPSDIEGLVY